MANETLQQLKIKPLPKAQEQFNIILNIPKEGDAPHIIDKTSEQLINRDQFFSTIQEYLEVVQKGYKKLSKMANIKGEEVVDAIKDAIKDKDTMNDDITTSKKDPKVGDPKNSFSQIVKTSAKLIITNPNEQTIKKSKIKLPSKERLTPKPGTQNLDKEKTIKQETKGQTIDESLVIPKDLRIGKTLYLNRIPKLEPNILIKAPSYYLDNREMFISFINSLFEPFKQQLLKEEAQLKAGKSSVSCDSSSSNDFSLLTHQKIVRDYINIYTPVSYTHLTLPTIYSV